VVDPLGCGRSPRYAVIGGLAQILWARKSHTDDLDLALVLDAASIGAALERTPSSCADCAVDATFPNTCVLPRSRMRSTRAWPCSQSGSLARAAPPPHAEKRERQQYHRSDRPAGSRPARLPATATSVIGAPENFARIGSAATGCGASACRSTSADTAARRSTGGDAASRAADSASANARSCRAEPPRRLGGSPAEAGAELEDRETLGRRVVRPPEWRDLLQACQQDPDHVRQKADHLLGAVDPGGELGAGVLAVLEAGAYLGEGMRSRPTTWSSARVTQRGQPRGSEMESSSGVGMSRASPGRRWPSAWSVASSPRANGATAQRRRGPARRSRHLRAQTGPPVDNSRTPTSLPSERSHAVERAGHEEPRGKGRLVARRTARVAPQRRVYARRRASSSRSQASS
jgi:hypothetical protein